MCEANRGGEGMGRGMGIKSDWAEPGKDKMG